MAVDAQTRLRVAERAEERCEYCRCPSAFSSTPYAVEHIRPRAAGGADAPANLAWACQGCNGHKYTAVQATDPATGRRPVLFHPRRQRWDDHFQWSEGALLVVGKTASGRATIERLQLNRPSVVNLRRALAALGEHPPPDDHA